MVPLGKHSEMYIITFLNSKKQKQEKEDIGLLFPNLSVLQSGRRSLKCLEFFCWIPNLTVPRTVWSSGLTPQRPERLARYLEST